MYNQHLIVQDWQTIKIHFDSKSSVIILAQQQLGSHLGYSATKKFIEGFSAQNIDGKLIILDNSDFHAAIANIRITSIDDENDMLPPSICSWLVDPEDIKPV